MKTRFVRTALAAGVTFGIAGLAGLAGAAPPPSTSPPSPTVPAAADPARPSPTPADPTPPTGSQPRSHAPGSTAPGTVAPTNPSATAGILNEHDIPGKAQTLSPKEARAAQKAVQDLHKVNKLEIALGALAQDRATSEPIRAYAKELVEAHQASDKKLADFAANHGFALASGPALATKEVLPAGTDTPVPERVPGAAMPSGDRPGGTVAGAGTGTGKTGSGTTAGTVTSPATTGTRPPPATTTPAAGTTPPEGTMGGSKVASDSSVPPDLDAEGRRTLAALQRLDGEKFDRQFLTTMVRGHSKTLGEIKGFEKSQKNTEIAALLSDARTMVEHHLDRAKALQRGGSVDNGGAGAAARERTMGAL
jgi:predicted outer membrane protein